jgi:hypothetical protein
LEFPAFFWMLDFLVLLYWIDFDLQFIYSLAYASYGFDLFQMPWVKWSSFEVLIHAEFSYGLLLW